MNTKIDDDVKNKSFERVYLLYGEERYLLNQKKQLLLSALKGDNDLNFATFEPRSVSEGALFDFAETLPFLSDYRVALLEDTGYFKEEAPAALVDYLSHIPEATVLIFSEKAADKRSRMYKAVVKNGAAVEYGREKEEVLLKWIAGILKQENKKITRETLADLLQRTGNDMMRIRSELDKLLSYCMERDEVTKKDLDAVISGITTDDIFDLIHAVAAKNGKEAFRIYSLLLEKKEAPFRILWHMTRQYKTLLQIRELDENGCGAAVIAERIGTKDWIVRKNLGLAKKFSLASLKEALSVCAETEEAIKTGRMDDRSALELLLASYCAGG